MNLLVLERACPLMHIRIYSSISFSFHIIRRFSSGVEESRLSKSHSSISDSHIDYLTISKIARLYNNELTPTQLLQISKDYTTPESKVDLALYNKLTGLNRVSDRVEIHDLLIILQSLANENIKNYDEFSFCSEVIKRKLNKMYNSTLEDGKERKYKPNKELLFSIFYVFTQSRILHYHLFDILSKLYIPFLKDSTFNELEVIVKCLAMQNHRNQLLDEIKLKIESSDKIPPNVAISLLYNYSLLSKVDEALLNVLERHIYGIDIGDKKREQYIEEVINSSIGVDHFSAGLLLYSYLLLKVIDYKLAIKLLDLQRDFLQNLPSVVDNITAKDTNHANRLYFIRSYLRVIHREFYNQIPMEIRILLRNLALIYPNKIEAKERVFPQKVSWHLGKMRIAHSLYLNRSGLVLDIVERDRRVVWLCNSYHRFYANSFTLTSQVQLEQELIRALGYSIVNIHYYQWNRMMIKDTRFAYLRMARYYALQDIREFDKSLMGWNLPYLWKNSNKSRIMADVSYSYKYQPLSHSPYTQ